MAHPTLRSLIDAAAAATLAGAVGFALVRLNALQPLLAICVAGIVFIRVFASLARLPAVPASGHRRFVPAPLQFDEELDELLLDQPLNAGAAGPRVVRLFETMPTPGEMHETIERHLEARQSGPQDATEELRQALAQLRRATA